MPPISHDDKIHVDFSDKCDAFIQAMYPKSTLDEENEDLDV